MLSHEGKSVFLETIEYLKAQKPVQKVAMHKGLSKASQGHADDLGKHNMMGHVGSNGSSMSERIGRHCVVNKGFTG